MTDNKYIGVQGLEELITLTKNSLAKKADTLQFDVMPDPVKYIGKVVQYVGVSDSSFTRSHFYYSDGTRWNEENISGEQTSQIKIVSALPNWVSADPQVLYVLKDTTDNTISLYVKNIAVNDAWYTVESSGSFAIVDSLPQWADANASIIYFKANGDALTGYIKNTGTTNAWYTLGGAAQEIDTALSSVSTNPVQNKVVYAAIQDVLAKIVNVYHFKGSCLTADLPSEGNAVGDTWNLEDDSSYGPAGTNVAWTGTEWDALSGDMNYMRGLHDPDWSKVITESDTRSISNGSAGTIVYTYTYTCPARGFAYIKFKGANGDCNIAVSNLNIVTSKQLDSSYYRAPPLPVNKDDTIKFDVERTTVGTTINFSYTIDLVPYKVQ